MTERSTIADQVEKVLRELVQVGSISTGQIIVIGTSTSEVTGRRIGTAGAQHVALQIYEGVERVRQDTDFYAAYQCCEHLNRALVVDRRMLNQFSLTEVFALPAPKAGGSMASHAYRALQQPCVVETIQAHAGIDIGETLIGMHLRPVAVPVRPSIRRIGEANVNMAYTRPKFIGGARAIYQLDAASVTNEPSTCD